ncbi:MAG: hypothetical protein Q9181_004152, partial [Wetmoreana brouardii]
MARHVVYFALAVFVSCSESLPSNPQIPLQDRSKSPFTPYFNQDVTRLMDEWHVPGLSIAVIDGNDTFNKGYGISIFPSVKVTPSTLFYTGSTTKAFTAAALALLIEDSANSSDPLKWRTPISSLIREDFVLPDEYATTHITLEDAASHRTGMPRHDSSYGGSGFELRDVVQNLRNLPLTAEIRTRFQYCNMMYMTLSYVIERLTGSWLGDVLWDRIWKPLNMTRTYFSFSQAQQAVENGAAELARGYVWNNQTQEYVETEWMDQPLVSGAGHVISNVEDYVKWLRFLMDQSPPLSKAGHMSLRHPRMVLEDQVLPGFTGTSAYALGWNVENYHGEPIISHSGGLRGFGSLVGYLPNRQYGIVVMGNTAETSAIVEYMLFFRLLDDYLGVEQKDRGDLVAVIEKLLLKPKVEQLRDPIKALYPKAPTGKDAIPLSRPLEDYTGTYYNKGYRNVNITLSQDEQHLHSITNHSFAYELEFQHVSGEFFVVKGYPYMEEKGYVDKTSIFQISLFKAEFRLGENGEIAEFGAAFESEMKDEKIWFKRVSRDHLERRAE